MVSDNVLTTQTARCGSRHLGMLPERDLMFVIATASVPVVCPGACIRDGGGLLGERGGEPGQGLAAAWRLGLAFQPGHSSEAYPGAVGKLLLREAMLKTQLSQSRAVKDGGPPLCPAWLSHLVTPGHSG